MCLSSKGCNIFPVTPEPLKFAEVVQPLLGRRRECGVDSRLRRPFSRTCSGPINMLKDDKIRSVLKKKFATSKFHQYLSINQ